MEFLPEDIQAYSDAHTEDEPELLSRLNRETHVNIMRPRMLSGHFQGRLLSFITHLINPKKVLEVGTYTGYSALSIAEGLAEDGKLVTIDKNEELESMVQQYIDEAGLSEKVEYRVGDAREIIPELDGGFDLVFLDADKESYATYYDLVFEKLNPGGVILADNVLWSGKVIPERRKKLDRDTEAILAFNDMVKNDDRVQCVLLPVRDGIMMARKK
ncbi:O-methyltransferase [Fulvitalea axinellae]|uniref:O-methyltransferase n=1 Tax=Fulvitalea axinellae TaxID=1182444 RepID=A0AAU9CS51_9BACT|nr:O-methyltransferase [Fulvitalea axinellae]